MQFYIIGYAAGKLNGDRSVSISPAVSYASASLSGKRESIDILAKAQLFDIFPPSKGRVGHTYVINEITSNVISFVLEATSMPLNPSQLWYMTPPNQHDRDAMLRYHRALRLSTMQREVETYEANKDQQSAAYIKRRQDAIEYRKRCIANWQDYLDGKVEPYTGRKTKS